MSTSRSLAVHHTTQALRFGYDGVIALSSSAEAQDQKRVTTPSDAIAAGADYLVIGRPISQAPDPAAAADAIVAEMAGVRA